MTSWSFDSKLQNWSGAQQPIISVEQLCIPMSAGNRRKMLKTNLLQRLVANIRHPAAVLMSVPGCYSVLGKISRSLLHLIFLSDQRKPISDPSHRRDKNLQYNGLFPLKAPPHSHSLAFCAAALCLPSLLHFSFSLSLPFRAELIFRAFNRYDRHKTSGIIGALVPLTRRLQQWRYSVTLLGSFFHIACWWATLSLLLPLLPLPPVDLEKAINIPLLSRGFSFRLEHTGCHLPTPTSQIITYLDVAEEVCACVCVAVRVCVCVCICCCAFFGLSPQPVRRRTKKWICHCELETHDGCPPRGRKGTHTRVTYWTISGAHADKPPMWTDFPLWPCEMFRLQLLLFFGDTVAYFIASRVIMPHLMESCLISAGDGLSVKAAEVKGFLKGQLTHRCCRTPFSSTYPHLLNLNHGWKAWPFISSVSGGCFFHLIPSRVHRQTTAGPTFLILPPHPR